MFLFLLAFGLLSGCSDQSQQGSVQQGEYFSVEFHPSETPVPTGKEIMYTVKLTHDKQPVSGAHVEVALEMQEMDHGENKFTVKEGQPGEYTGKAILPMSGAWQAYIRVEKDGKSETIPASFEAVGEMVEPK